MELTKRVGELHERLDRYAEAPKCSDLRRELAGAECECEHPAEYDGSCQAAEDRVMERLYGVEAIDDQATDDKKPRDAAILPGLRDDLRAKYRQAICAGEDAESALNCVELLFSELEATRTHVLAELAEEEL